jgi:hypothetical protein
MSSHPLLKVKSINGKYNGNESDKTGGRPLPFYLNRKPNDGVVTRLWQWIASKLIDEVSPGDALCEFDCRRTQCTLGDWSTCSRRLAQADGELSPEPEDVGTRARAVG